MFISFNHDHHKTAWILISAVFMSLCSTLALAQRAGQSVSIQYGVVTSARQVDLRSNAVPGGALVGGALGIASASGKSSGRKARNSLIGAIAGGVIANSARGDTRGMLYDVNLVSQGQVQIVSDQREIRIGDCVAVEQAGGTANIRRMSSAYCEPTNAAAVTSVESESRREAESCRLAKQELVDATTAQEVDLAARKIALLCDD
jgi:uncharacterized protein YcfJ